MEHEVTGRMAADAACACGRFLVSRLMGFSEKTARTVSIETGMQNSALACVLARNSLPHPSSSLPGPSAIRTLSYPLVVAAGLTSPLD